MKKSNRTKINLLFSSFLVIGYIVCTYFFSSLASQVAGNIGALIQILVLVLFGLLLFYATRVGDGKQVKRFSLAVLLLVDLPTLYIILATFVQGLPFHDALASSTIIFTLACVAFGYGVPYTFLSGYEMAYDDDETEEPADEEEKPLEGGIAEELAEISAAEETSEDIAEAEEISDEEEA